MRQWRATVALLSLLILLSVSMLQGCSGGAPKVASITVFPSPVSLAYGQVIQLTPATLDNKGNAVVTTVTYTSSNTQVIGVSPAGMLCGGTWDASFINCTPPSTPQPTSATLTITAESITVTVPAYLHEPVTSVQITSAPNGCTSAGTTATAAFQATAFTNSTAVCGSTVPCAIPPGDLVGQAGVQGATNNAAIQWTSADTTIATIDTSGTATNGLATAVTPGATSIVAAVGGVTSSAKTFTSCPITSITLSTSAPPPVSAPSGNSATLTATLVDQNNTTFAFTAQSACTTEPSPTCSFPAVSWLSTDLYSVTATGQTKNVTATTTATSGTTTTTASVPLLEATATSSKPGTATLITSCGPPNCNKNLASVYSNPITQTTTGNANSTIYVASTQSTSMYPIAGSNASVGTAIALPSTPNSFLFNHQGTKAVLGSNTGVMLFDPVAVSVTTVGFSGTVLKISPDGAFAVVAGQVTGQIQNSIGIIDLTHNSLRTSFAINGTAINPNDPAVINGLPPLNVLADFTPDSQYLWVATANGAGASPNRLYTYQFNGTSAGVSSIALTNPTTDLVFLASGPLAYMLGQTDSHSITAFATCKPAATPIDTLTGSSPTALRALPDATGVAALDISGSTLNFDLVQLTAPQTPFNSCPPTVAGAETLTTQALALNALTAAQINQLFLTPGGNTVLAGSAAILTTNVPVTATASAATPSVTGNIVIFTLEQVGSTQAGLTLVVPLQNGATVAYQGDAVADNSAFYVGGNDGTVHKMANGTDLLQIPVAFTAPAVPNLVAVRNQ